MVLILLADVMPVPLQLKLTGVVVDDAIALAVVVIQVIELGADAAT